MRVSAACLTQTHPWLRSPHAPHESTRRGACLAAAEWESASAPKVEGTAAENMTVDNRRGRGEASNRVLRRGTQPRSVSYVSFVYYFPGGWRVRACFIFFVATLLRCGRLSG